MKDREQLEARATELGIQFTDGWKDTTLENRIAAQEKTNAEAEANVTGSTDVIGSADNSATGDDDQTHAEVDVPKDGSTAQTDQDQDQEQSKSGETDASQSTEKERAELLSAVSTLHNETPLVPEPMNITAVGYVDVTGPAKGRWRIGKHFTRQTQRLELDDLTEAELAALKNDPELAVTVVPVP